MVEGIFWDFGMSLPRCRKALSLQFMQMDAWLLLWEVNRCSASGPWLDVPGAVGRNFSRYKDQNSGLYIRG